MSVDLLKIMMSSRNSSLKVWKQDDGTISFPAIGSGGGSVWKTITIPHGYPNDKLIWQVGFRESDGSFQNAFMTPFESGDGQLNAFATLDSQNLYFSIGWETSDLPATSFEYIYRILIP